MRNTVAKKLRKLFNPENAISRRVYRRVKKRYNGIPKSLRPAFLRALEAMVNARALNEIKTTNY